MTQPRKIPIVQVGIEHPQRRNVTASMVGLINSHMHKNLIKVGEPQRHSWAMQKEKKKKELNSGPSTPDADALTTRPARQYACTQGAQREPKCVTDCVQGSWGPVSECSNVCICVPGFSSPYSLARLCHRHLLLSAVCPVAGAAPAFTG